MKIIDIENWKRKKQYEQFSEFLNPCYTAAFTVDVTRVVRCAKENGGSFFAYFVYVLTDVCNRFEGFRLRMDENKNVICYDVVHPSYTVLLPDNGYDVCRTEFQGDLFDFSARVRRDIDMVRSGNNGQQKLNGDGKTDVLYYSCVPWVEVRALTDPLPLGNIPSMSIPRINWGKFTQQGDKFTMNISFTLNHALIDGYELSQTVLRLQEALDGFDGLFE